MKRLTEPGGAGIKAAPRRYANFLSREETNEPRQSKFDVAAIGRLPRLTITSGPAWVANAQE
ncbi:hypothetical protein [Devosia faecipullorum]|uniref:hypothetical protein n=1 Tax=Devosia faecipullorum TaxID=2755039 RepID=UPI00187B437A|nr:hypothetical protein [Devosia faecipullorum]MBE7732254.1 hypothetical protein [Devosia faecipullorum]